MKDVITLEECDFVVERVSVAGEHGWNQRKRT